MGVNTNPERLSGKVGIVDGYSGEIFPDPSNELLLEYQELVTEETELSRMVEQTVDLEASTNDGKRIQIMLNAGLSADTSISLNKNVDGVGLYRTEISFLLQQQFPSEEEQVHQYRSVLGAYPTKRVVMRTLDIGGDKPLPYLPIDED